jgi:hypothetical protein
MMLWRTRGEAGFRHGARDGPSTIRAGQNPVRRVFFGAVILARIPVALLLEMLTGTKRGATSCMTGDEK